MVLSPCGCALGLFLSASTSDSYRLSEDWPIDAIRRHFSPTPPLVYVGKPEILAAIAGLPKCIGVPGVEEGRAWGCPLINFADCAGNTETNLGGGCVSPHAVSAACLGQGVRNNTGLDGTPVTFNWPVDMSSLKHDHFQYNFADGSTTIASCAIAGGGPANEPNELQTIAIFGNAGGWEEFATSLEIVGDLMLVAPNGTKVSARGLTYSGPSLDVDNGPFLLTVHLEHFTTVGEVLRNPLIGNKVYPNHCQVNFPQTTHRLRLLFNGGVTLDGLRAATPDRTDLFVVADAAGQPLPTDSVLGLADLGHTMPETQCEKDAYATDGDNYVDICLSMGADTPMPASVHVRCTEDAMLVNPKGLRYPCSAQTVEVTDEPY